MKTNYFFVISFTLVMIVHATNLIAQVTTPSNSGNVGDYVGWQLNENKNLDIVNEDQLPINFYTDAGVGGSGSLSNLRMFIQGGDGNVGIGNFGTANTLLHLHQSADHSTVNFQMTNVNIGNLATNGFLIDVDPNGVLALRQQELQPMRFWGMDARLGTVPVIRAEFTSGQAMLPNSAAQTPTDGFRIWNPGYASSGGAYLPLSAIDIWTGESGTTHMRYDHSGLIQGINLQFEQYARLRGFWFNAQPLLDQASTYRGEYYFNIDSIEVSRFSNANNTNRGFTRIGLQPTGQLGATGIDATRRLEVYDVADVPQVRITRTVDGSFVPQVFTDLQTTNFGDFIMMPTYYGDPAQVGIGTTTPGSPLEVHSPGYSAGTHSTLRLQNNSSVFTSSGIRKGVDIEVSGANTQLIALNSYIPSGSSTGGTYGWQHTDYNSGSMATATGAYFDMSGSNMYATGIKLNLTNTNTNSSSETYGLYNTVTGASPATWGLRLNTNSTSTASGAILYGVSSDITGSGGNQNEVIALRGYNTKSGSTSNYGVTGYATNGTYSYGVYGTAGYGSTTNYGIYSNIVSPYCTTGSCSNAAIYAAGPAYTTNDWWKSSDANIKKNILLISDYWAILDGLNGYWYDFDTTLNSTTNLNLSAGPQMGLIAQEVEVVAPELVKSFINPGSIDSLGVVKNNISVKSLNYDGLIPVLVEAIKDLKAQVDSLISNSASQRLMNDDNTLENQSMKSEVVNKQKIVLSNQQGIILNQNDPNPFTESTRITFQIPDEVRNAKIIFTSISGTIINTAIINERGVGELEVYSSELSKGLYNYTLVCDGQVIATKKMVKQ